MNRESAVAFKRVEYAVTAIMQKQEDMTNAKKVGLTTRMPEKTCKEMLNALRESLSDVASSDHEEDADYEENDEEHRVFATLSKHDEPGRVIGTISKMVHQRMESFRQKQMRLHTFMQPGWGDAADYIRERDVKYGTAEFNVPVQVKPLTDKVTTTPAPTTFGKIAEILDIVPGTSPMPQGTSRPGSRHMREHSVEPVSHTRSVSPT